MAELRLSYTTIEEIVDFFYKEQELYPLLFGVSKEFEVYPEIVSGINRIMDDKGTIRDTASEDLKKIRCRRQRTATCCSARID